MKNKVESGLDLVGNTPLVELGNGIYAKAEFLNPSGSIKDRMIKFMAEEAEKRGELKRGSIITEATSGNTGISLSMIASLKGYKVKIFMPEEMSVERRKMMLAFGATLELTETMDDAVEKAKELGGMENHFYMNQFGNKDNIEAHYKTTGQEILQQLNGKKIDAFVAGIGTGGTLMGVGKALKEKLPSVKLIGVMPKDRKNEIEGIGCYYSEEIIDEKFFDKIIEVTNEDAFNSARELAKKFGFFVGPSSGANYLVAKNLGLETVVTVLPDSGNRYLSTELFGSKSSI